jgi:hypothetical protein
LDIWRRTAGHVAAHRNHSSLFHSNHNQLPTTIYINILFFLSRHLILLIEHVESL